MKPAFPFVISLLMVFTAFTQFRNVTVSTYEYPNEPSIMINPKAPNVMVAGANTKSYYYSDDFGFSWTRGTLTSTYGIWGGPCIIVDTAGSFYFLHLSNPSPSSFLDRIVCRESTDNGQSWNNLVRPAWARLDNSAISIVTAIVDSANIVHTPELEPVLPVALEQNYPNPASRFTYMSFKLHKPAIVTLTVHDIYGKLIAALLDSKYLEAGRHVEGMDLETKNLSPGMYYYQLATDEKVISRIMIIR